MIVTLAEDNRIQLWKANGGDIITALTGHSELVSSFDITADSKPLTTAAHDKTVRTWNLETFACISVIEAHTDEVNDVTLTSEGRLALTASNDGSFKIHSIKTGADLFAMKGHAGTVRLVKTTPDELKTILAVGPELLILPHLDLANFAADVVSPAWHLEWLANLDMDVPNAQQQFAAVKEHLDRPGQLPDALLASRSFFEYLARQGRDDGLQLLLSPEKIPCMHVKFSLILRAAHESGVLAVIDAVLSIISDSLKNRIKVMDGSAEMSGYLSDFAMDDEDLVKQLIGVNETHPELLLKFLNDLPLAFVDDPRVLRGFHGKASMKPTKMICVPAAAMHPESFWANYFASVPKSSNPPIAVEACMTPFPNFATPGFLSALLGHQDAEYFGNLLTWVVVQHKWNSFGRRLFLRQTIYYYTSSPLPSLWYFRSSSSRTTTCG